ncbi:hypothetical protein [Enorma sp.]|uniref:hypothetical protein n=1 Tax=Enorma sp. TaxID=1920692 RepID=UPI0025C54EF6|nr:hypothetical protein [Enorma sp.]
MRNKQIDLDNHLFAQMERLNDESLTGEELEREIKRARAISSIAAQINESRANSLKAARFMDEACGSHPSLPEGFR